MVSCVQGIFGIIALQGAEVEATRDWSASAPWMVALLAATVAALVGFYNYQFNMRVKRIEYLEKIGESLRTNASIVAVTRMLDWDVRSIEIGGTRIHYNVKMLEAALINHRILGPDKVRFSAEQVVIRDSFDDVFNLLEQARYAAEIKLIKVEDLLASPLAYYVGKLLEKDVWTQKSITKYLKAYEFSYTLILFSEYKRIKDWNAADMGTYPAFVETDDANFKSVEHQESAPKG